MFLNFFCWYFRKIIIVIILGKQYLELKMWKIKKQNVVHYEKHNVDYYVVK